MCQASGGIQDTWSDWPRLNRTSGSAPATAPDPYAAQRSHTPRRARTHHRVAACAGRASSDSQFSSAHTSTTTPYAVQRGHVRRPGRSSRSDTSSRTDSPAPATTSA